MSNTKPKSSTDQAENISQPSTDSMNLEKIATFKEPGEAHPSHDAKDPLNWPLKLKIIILLQVSWLAALGTWNTSIINPAYSKVAKEFHMSIVNVSYQTTIAIALNGIGPFIWIPLANVYGRRPVYLFTTMIGFASALGSAYAKDFHQLLVARAFNGIFPVALALAPATITDLFFFHQRGRAMGIFTVFLTSGAHFAGIIGGLIGEFAGWRWTFKTTAIMNAVTILVLIFGLPETLYVADRDKLTRSATSREPHLAELEGLASAPHAKFSKKEYLHLLRPWSIYPELKLSWKQFVLPVFKMAKYPSVLFPALYYGAQYSIAAIMPAVTVAYIFETRYEWNTLQIGLAYGGTFTIGAILGELASGMVVDWIVKRQIVRHDGESPPPEVRLQAIWTGAILVPAGLLIYGFCLAYPVPWAPALLGMFMSIFGLQVIATTCYTYSIDCYRIEGSEVSQFFNFVRQEFGMTVAFYTVRLCKRIGYQYAFILFAILGSVLAFLPILWLMKYGRQVRKQMGEPHNVNVFDGEDKHSADSSELGAQYIVHQMKGKE